MLFSLVIPCYNEALSLPKLIEKCEELTKEVNIEVIIVNNGSTDNTIEVMNDLIKDSNKIKFCNVIKNIGYGHGILEGLKCSTGEIVGWTHADLQTDPIDAVAGCNIFLSQKNPKKIFVKGKRFGRPLFDNFFTIGMSFFETILLRKIMWDINAQPTFFHREFYDTFKNPPLDFSLDLFVYFLAKKSNFEVHRIPVFFGARSHGQSHWNYSLKSKYNFIKRTLLYSLKLRKRLKEGQ